MNKKKAIYIIGGGELGIKIIEWASEVGLKTIVTDKNPSSPGILISDISINIDALDENEHINQVKILSAKYNIVGVYCQIESALLVRHSILSYLNLPTNSLKSLDISMNKELMKMCWLKESILTPEYREISSLEELSKFLNVREGNFVIKPTKGSGSRGVQSVNKHSNYENVYKLCMNSVAGDGHIIIEEKINGRSIDANGILIKGKFYPAGILEKFQIGRPTFLPLGGNEIMDMSEDEKLDIYSMLERAAASIGLTEGPIKADLIKKDGNYYILEVAARLHGDITTCNILPYGSGINPIKFYFSYLFNEDILRKYLTPNIFKRKYALWRVICLPPGKLKNLSLPKNNKNNSIIKIWINNKINNHIQIYNDTRTIPGYICCHGISKEDAENKLEDYFKEANFKIDINPDMIKWYKTLGKRIDSLGLKRSSCGYVNC